MQSKVYKAAASTLATASRDSQTLQLEGRVLGFAEYGSPTGFPVFYFHGYPTSRLDGSGGDKEAAARNIRFICPDRPGYGLSTYQQARQIIDWPQDVAALADHLRLDRFAVIGGSGGGPYALACAQAIPQRLTAVGVFAGAPPWYALPKQKKPWYWGPLRSAAINTPGVLGSLLTSLIAATRWIASTTFASKRLEAFRGDLSQQELLRILFEGFAKGPAGAVQETRLLSSDWGLKLGTIEPTIKIWHGSKDTNAPIEYIRELARLLPHAHLKDFPDEDHYTIAKRFGECLDELLPPSARN